MIQVEDNAYKFIIECPGLDRDSLGVSFTGNILDVEWTRKDKTHVRSFVLRSGYFNIPASSYEYGDGVVVVTVPYQKEPTFKVPRQGNPGADP